VGKQVGAGRAGRKAGEEQEPWRESVQQDRGGLKEAMPGQTAVEWTSETAKDAEATEMTVVKLLSRGRTRVPSTTTR